MLDKRVGAKLLSYAGKCTVVQKNELLPTAVGIQVAMSIRKREPRDI